MKNLILAWTLPVLAFLVCGAVYGIPEECKENTEELDSDARVIQLAPGERLKDAKWGIRGRQSLLWVLTYEDFGKPPRTYTIKEYGSWDSSVVTDKIIIKEQ